MLYFSILTQIPRIQIARCITYYPVLKRQNPFHIIFTSTIIIVFSIVQSHASLEPTNILLIIYPHIPNHAFHVRHKNIPLGKICQNMFKSQQVNCPVWSGC